MNGANDIGDMISKLTENPEMMKTLMGIAGKLKDSSGEQNSYNRIEVSPRECEQKAQGDSCGHENKDFCCNKPRKGDDAENLIRLLLALKPYVGADRCEKIDNIIKILKLIQLSEKTGLFNSFL